MSEITRGELARGFISRAAWTDFSDRFVNFPFNDAVAWQAAVIFNDLRRRGLPTRETICGLRRPPSPRTKPS